MTTEEMIELTEDRGMHEGTVTASRKTSRFLRRILAFSLVGVAIAVGPVGCGGGGGGSDPDLPSPPPSPPSPPSLPSPPPLPSLPSPPSLPSTPVEPPDTSVRDSSIETLEPDNPEDTGSWETDEYRRSNGLALIRAAEGYAIRTTGRPGGGGITVAVLDNGVGHSELGDRREYVYPPAAQVPGDHGTPVAGVVAARRNGTGIHGVAYNANLVSLAACLPGDMCFSSHMIDADVIAAGIASAAGLTRSYGSIEANPEASAHIMNMSFTLPNIHEVPRVTSVMRDAAEAGRIVVAALGNCGNGGADCALNGGVDDGIGPSGIPAANVADSGIAGFAIAVGSLNQGGDGKAIHSNTCGPEPVARYCLFAPGEGVNTVRRSGGVGPESGTSFATPHVAGAAAVVWGAFPNKRADQIVERLLTTARRLDGLVISPTYGRGALDLGAAMNPVGFLSLSVKRTGMVPLAESFVDLPPGFGMPSGLAEAVVYDEQMFPFLTDLATSFRVHSARSSIDMLRGFLSSFRDSASVLPLGSKAAFEFAHEVDRFASDRHRPDRAIEKEEGDYRLHFHPWPGLVATVGRGFGSLGSSNDFIARRTGRAILRDGVSVGPFAAFAGHGPDVSLGWRLNDDTVLDLAAREGRGYFGSTRARLGSIGLTGRIGEALTVGTRCGMLRENGSLMGLRTEGAFGSIAGVATDFLDLSVEGRVSDDLSLFGSFSHGRVRDSSGGGGESLVSGWGHARAHSVVLGGELGDLWQASDRLTLTAALPLRVQRATVHVDVPDREVADGVVRYVRQTADLAPRGRERRLQLVYEAGRDDRVAVAVGGYVRIEPDHDSSAAPEFGAAAVVRLRF